MKPGGPSRTAVFVCQGRAAADGRLAVGRFSDPVAARLLRAEELETVQLARGEPGGTRDSRTRLAVESVRACADVVAPRTVVIDEAITSAVGRAAHPQAVLLGAGLDTRPWRLSALADATVYAVDHPASQADAHARCAGLGPVATTLVPVAVDLATQSLGEALDAAGHDPSAPTVWVWEGVVPYLTRAAVATTVASLAQSSGPGSTLVVNYQAPSLVATVGRRLSTLAARRLGIEALTADEQWRSAWTAARMARLLTRHGFTVERDVDLLQAAVELGTPTTHARSLRNGQIAVAVTGHADHVPR